MARARENRFPLLGWIALVCAWAGALGLIGPIAVEPALAQEAPPSLKGRMLVATEAVRGAVFENSVVYIIDHDASGALGLVVNKPIGSGPLSGLLEALGIEFEADAPGAARQVLLRIGGPVESGRMFVLHSVDFRTDGTERLGAGVAMSAADVVLAAVLAGSGPARSMIAMGYAGWSPGQLEAEIARGSWEIAPGEAAIVFDEGFASKWERAMALVPFDL